MHDDQGEEASESDEPERILTGIPGLDTVLGGGFVRGAIYLLMGRPGTGKTTLGNQLCFGHSRHGRAVYVTMLAESHASMLKNLQKMEFFERSVVNRQLFYVGAYKALREHGLRALLDVVRQVIRDHRASLLVVDGISPARAHAQTDVALKEFIVELQTLCSMTDCTALLLANMTSDDANGAEHTMVDGLIELTFERSSKRTNRALEVIKLRGSRHLLGRQELVITDRGCEIHPRVEDLVVERGLEPQALEERVPSGIAELDAMLGGGFVAGTTSILLGFTGSGKTTLGLSFLDAAAGKGIPSLYFGFYEPPGRILAAADAIGLGLRDAEERGKFAQIWQPPYDYGLDGLGRRLFDDVQRRGVRRLVIDGLDGFRQAAVDPDRTIRFITALTNELRGRGVTTLVTEETPRPYGPEVATRVEGTSALADAIVLLEYLTVGTDLRRLISVIKQRETAHQLSVREFALTNRGLRVDATSDGADALLSGPDPISARNRKPRSIPRA